MGYGLVDAHLAVVHAMEYGHDATIMGSNTLADCEANVYYCDFLHPEIFTYSWSATSNLNIIENLGASVRVMPVSVGTGTLAVNVYQQGRLMYTLTKTINVTSVWSGVTPVATTPFNITSNTTWSTETYLPVTATIDPNVTLTITGNLLCGGGGRLVVRPGGKLIVDGGVLTSACAGEMWQGIEVVGDRTKRQQSQYQGTVELRNGARIENALCAVRTGLREDTVAFATTGGIVSASDAVFKNNRQSVVINSYAYTALSGSISNYNAMFARCTFAVDNDNLFAANNVSFAEHVRLWDVKGVTFEGCTFSNSTNNPYWNGKGIYAEDAGVLVNTYCPPQPTFVCECPETDATYSSFSGFTTAVEVNTSGNPYAVRLDGCRFSNSGTGVRINGNQFTTVTRCDFDLTTCPESVRSNYGLYLNGCSGYKVEENTFLRTTYPTGPFVTDNSTGVYVSSSGITPNSLYRNTFGKLTRGIFVSGQNGLGVTGLCMSCNNFSDDSYDIYVAPKASVDLSQGSSTKGADNTFANTLTSSFHNSGWDAITYYYGNGSVPTNPYQVVKNGKAAANPCASTLCGNGGGVGPGPTPFLLSGFTSQVNAYATAMAGNVNTDGTGMDGVETQGQTVETQNFASLQQGETENLSETAQSLSATYHTAVRSLMADTVLDLNELEQWHAAAQPLADPYSLTETRFVEGYAEVFAADMDDAELANYAEFHAMKVALRGDNNDNVDNQDNSGTPFVNWYALSPAQIAQMQAIAERNTGRASVMAKGVLCFFHGICYEDDWAGAVNIDDPVHTNLRTRRSALRAEPQTNTHSLTVYPNPADDLLHIELAGGAGIASATLYDLQGRAVRTRFIASANSQTATVDVRGVPAGVYMLRVTDNIGKEHHQKIVVKN